jgi:Asp-tRNA(Asn)/Glu-tRNA(Gln) amidotransferase A subunit family amidase
MALHASDLLYFCKVAFGHPASDVVPLLFRDNSAQAPIRYGFCASGPFMESSPVCQRAVKTAVIALKSSGVDVVEYQFPESFQKLVVSFYSLMSADGWKFYLNELGTEPREPCIRNLLTYASFPDCLKRLCSSISRLFVKDPRALAIISAIRSKDTYSLIQLQSELSGYEQEFHRSIASAGINVLITPTHVLPANPIGSFGDIHFTAAYTFAWNLLNVPIGCLPVVRFDSNLDNVEGEWPRKFEFKDIFSSDLLERAAKNYYNPKHVQGLPAGIQLIGLPNDDERVLSALVQLEGLLSSRQ